MREKVRFRVNGQEVAVETAPETRLAEILRERLALTGCKIGCAIGRCGACAVLIDGALANACLVMAYRLEGAEVITSEGLGALPAGRAARQALADEVAFQCGFCAPGMTVAVTALLQEGATDDESVREALAGNLCRCSGYLSILRAAETAATQLASDKQRASS
jgi:carbon-monoxide dehydrogenase small subunit